MATLSDEVAAQIMGELHILTEKIEAQQARTEAVAQLVVDAAKSVNTSKTILHKQNEALLMDRVKEISLAVQELRSMQSSIQEAASVQIAPVIEQMSIQVKALSEKDTYAMKFLIQTKTLLEKTKLSQNIQNIQIPLCVFLVLAAYSAGRWLH